MTFTPAISHTGHITDHTRLTDLEVALTHLYVNTLVMNKMLTHVDVSVTTLNTRQLPQHVCMCVTV